MYTVGLYQDCVSVQLMSDDHYHLLSLTGCDCSTRRLSCSSVSHSALCGRGCAGSAGCGGLPWPRMLRTGPRCRSRVWTTLAPEPEPSVDDCVRCGSGQNLASFHCLTIRSSLCNWWQSFSAQEMWEGLIDHWCHATVVTRTWSHPSLSHCHLQTWTSISVLLPIMTWSLVTGYSVLSTHNKVMIW